MMGKDFISVKMNKFDLGKVFNILIKGEFIEGTSTKKPTIREVADIDVGSSGTKQSIMKLKDGGYYVVNKTIKTNKLQKLKEII